MRFRSAFAYLFLLATIASAIVLTPAGPYIILILTLTGLGIPIALLLMAMPTIVLFMALSGFLWLLFGSGGWASKLAASLLAIAVLTSIPFYVNHRFDENAHILASRDHDDVTAVTPIRTLAIIDPTSRNGQPRCGELCRRLLLNGNVAQLILAQDDRLNPTPGLMGTLYRRYDGADCPDIAFEDQVDDLHLEGAPHRAGAKSTRDLLKLAALNGHCIDISQASVDVADAVIIRSSLFSGQPAPSLSSWDVWAQDMRSSQLLLLQARNGHFFETYRRTVVHYQRLFPILAPGITGIAFNGFGDNRIGLIRLAGLLGAKSIYQDKPDIVPLLVDRLHFNLTLDQDAAASDTRTLAASALHPRPPGGRDPAPAIAILFESIAWNNRPDLADLDIASQLIIDRNIELPNRLGAVVRHIVAQKPELGATLAAALFPRLNDELAATSYSGLPRDSRARLRNVAEAIASLPGRAVRDHYAVFDRIARDDASRQIAAPIFRQLPEFGPKGLSLALYLLEDSWRFRKPDRPVNDAWQAPYLAGLLTICRMGPAARDALPRLDAMAAQDRIARFGPYLDLWNETRQRLTGTSETKHKRACTQFM